MLHPVKCYPSDLKVKLGMRAKYPYLIYVIYEHTSLLLTELKEIISVVFSQGENNLEFQ